MTLQYSPVERIFFLAIYFNNIIWVLIENQIQGKRESLVRTFYLVLYMYIVWVIQIFSAVFKNIKIFTLIKIFLPLLILHISYSILKPLQNSEQSFIPQLLHRRAGIVIPEPLLDSRFQDRKPGFSSRTVNPGSIPKTRFLYFQNRVRFWNRLFLTALLLMHFLHVTMHRLLCLKQIKHYGWLLPKQVILTILYFFSEIG